MLEFLEQVLGVGFLGIIVISYMYIVSQKCEIDKIYEQYLNRNK